jgi:hypothetical protein
LTQVDDSPAKPRSWLGRVALLLSLVAAAVAVILAYVLVAQIRGWDWSFFGQLPGDTGAYVVLAWFAVVLAGLVLGVVQLLRPSQSRREPAIAAILGVASLAVLALLLVVSFDSGFPSERHRPDDELIADFEAHRGQFAEAVEQFRARDWVDASLLKALDVNSDGVIEYPRGVITFTDSVQGIAVSGSSKGYAYSKTPPKPLVEATDSYRGGDGGGFLVYRHIEGPWYIYYDVTV